jgi:hypothetical protein
MQFVNHTNCIKWVTTSDMFCACMCAIKIYVLQQFFGGTSHYKICIITSRTEGWNDSPKMTCFVKWGQSAALA